MLKEEPVRQIELFEARTRYSLEQQVNEFFRGHPSITEEDLRIYQKQGEWFADLKYTVEPVATNPELQT